MSQVHPLLASSAIFATCSLLSLAADVPQASSTQTSTFDFTTSLIAYEHETFDSNSSTDQGTIDSLSGALQVDYATPDSDSDPTLGYYLSGAPASVSGDGTVYPTTDMSFFIEGLGDDAFERTFTPFNQFLGYIGDNNRIDDYSPAVTVGNNIAEPFSVYFAGDTRTAPAGSDLIYFFASQQTSGSRSGSQDTLKILLIDETGTALANDNLPTTISLEDFAFAQASYIHSSTTGSGTSSASGLRREAVASIQSILTDSPASTPTLTVSASPLNEGLIGLPVTFTLDQPAVGGERFDFALEANTANPFEDYQPYSEYHEFLPGETTLTIDFTLVDDAVIEPDEIINLTLSNPVGLTLQETTIPLVILNDDSVLDDYGNYYGLPVPERSIAADGDGDGIEFFLEYAFNLNPTLAEFPDYIAGQTYTNGDEPTGLPVIVTEGDTIKYIYLRRTDSYPKIEYITEVSEDALTFNPTPPSAIIPITDHWEEVQVILSEPGKEPPRCFARVTVIAHDLNGDGF